jgi:hypothetical protein
MTKETMIKNYRKFSAAQGYIIGFEYKHQIYMITLEEIAPRFTTVMYMSKKNGGGRKLQFVLKKAHKEQLIRKGATLIGNEEILEGRYNKGVEFERLISEMNGQEFRGKENVGFWVEGDLEINGMQYQIKFNGAQIVTEKTLERLKRAGK